MHGHKVSGPAAGGERKQHPAVLLSVQEHRAEADEEQPSTTPLFFLLGDVSVERCNNGGMMIMMMLFKRLCSPHAPAPGEQSCCTPVFQVQLHTL